MWKEASPETRDRLANVLERVMEVAAKADAVADKAAAAAAEAAADKAADDAADAAALQAEYTTADAAIIRHRQTGSQQPFDGGDVYDLWKHTPLLKKGGSRKRSINCRRPRGFSQRQHCKYGRRGRGRGWKTRRLRV